MEFDDPDIQLSIPIKPIYEELCCPICFNAIKDCYITPCGHNFCSACIFECINRKHCCPCCNRATVKEDIHKNHHFDRLLTLVDKHKEEASKKYFEGIINGKLNASGGAQSSANSNGPAPRQSTQLSPVETLFHKHLKKSLLSYEEYFRELQVQFEASSQRIQREYAGKLANVPPAQREELANECAQRVGECEAAFKHVTDLLLSAYEVYLKEVSPTPEILPVTLSLVIPSRNVHIEQVIFKPSDTVRNIRTAFEKVMGERGNAITAWSQSNVLVLKRGAGSDEILLRDEDKPLSHYRPHPGAEILVMGDVQLASDKPPECFTVAFTKNPGQACDYFTCKDCKLNWVCKSCVDHCHKGHSVNVYILGHRSTWACCYCPKNQKCVIENNKTKK